MAYVTARVITALIVALMGQTNMNKHLLQLAVDADFTNQEIKAGLIPTRSLFSNVKELAYLCEVDEVIENAIEATASGGPVL